MRSPVHAVASLFFLCLPNLTAQLAPVAAPATPAVSSHPQMDAYKQARALGLMNDFAELARYHAANAALGPPRAGEQRVVFLGDSITDAWKLDQYFPGKAYINRGISGQTTSQMLLRLRQDVIDLQPHVMVVLAGTNDIAGNTGPISIEDIEKNFASIAELARAHHIVTIFSSVTPVVGGVVVTRPPAEILALNTWLKDYCAATGDIYLDYFGALVDERGLLRTALSNDGLHPNDAGYKIMAPMAESAIEKALQM